MDKLCCNICKLVINEDDKKVTVRRIGAETINRFARQRGVDLVAKEGDTFHKGCQVQLTRKDRIFKEKDQGENEIIIQCPVKNNCIS